VTDPICQPNTAFATAVAAVRSGDQAPEQAVAGLLAKLTDDELLGLLDGDLPFRGLLSLNKRFRTVPTAGGQVDRLGIPGVRFTDGPRGVVLGASTNFPVATSRAATWDTALEQAIGDAIGAEVRARGANLFAGICVNLAPAPGWGRSQESYGEDPVLIGAMGAAVIEGVHPWAMTCVKHFALNSMEEARFQVDVRVAEDVLREVYLPHFRVVVEAGVDSVMSAYNSVNGEWAGENGHLLTEILRQDWGFAGFVQTDWVWGLRHPVESVAAGQELEMPIRQQHAAALPAALRDGRLARADVERAATRLLTAQLQLALRAHPAPAADVVVSPKHRELAREAARRGCVLLRNEPVEGAPVLPLVEQTLKRLAVLGSLADKPNLGDIGSSMVSPPSTVSVLQGLRERLGQRVVQPDSPDLPAAVAAAREADAAVVVVGLSETDEGESIVAVDTDAVRLFGGIARYRPIASVVRALMALGTRGQMAGGDRSDLHLHAGDVELIRAVAAANDRTIVVVIAGGTVMLDPWDSEVTAVLLAWYPGMEGGRAVADLLLGDAEPAGRLPFVIPRRREHLPVVDWHARTVTYGRWWGQRKLDHDGNAAAYPFGFGLGYTSFTIYDLTVGPVDGERFQASVSVSNAGPRAGRHVVQIYAHQPDTGGRPVRVLLGFAAVAAGSGQTVHVTVDCTTRPLQRWTGDHLQGPDGRVILEAASYSGDPAAVTGELITHPAAHD
jgi:beta-glucosidase